jgi:hypothetical protein
MKNQTLYYYSYVGMMTFLNWVPPVEAVPPQYWKALAAMEVVPTGTVTFAQLQQDEQLQYTPSTDRRRTKIS